MNKSIKYTISGLMMIFVATIFVTGIANAQTPAENMPDNSKTQYTLLEPLPDLSKANDYKKTITFKEYVEYAFNLIIALSAAAAVFMIVFGGFQYMTTDSWKGKSEGLGKVKNALLGLLLVLGSYLLLRTIDPRLVNIPSTLVKPLEIKYEKTANSLLDSLSNISNYRYINQKLIDEQKELYPEIKRLKERSGLIRSEIEELIGESDISDEELNDYCTSLVKDIDGLNKLCGDYYVSLDETKKVETKFEYNIGVGKLNAKIQDCYSYRIQGSVSTLYYGDNEIDSEKFKMCQEQMAQVKNEQVTKLKNLGSVEEASIVEDYYKLALATSNMNRSLINNLGENPYAIQAINTLQSSITVVGTAAGAALGGAPGGVAGYIVTQTSNGIMNGYIAGENKLAAQKTTLDVRNQYIEYSQRIKSSEIRAQLRAQTNAYLKGLGVKETELIK